MDIMSSAHDRLTTAFTAANIENCICCVSLDALAVAISHRVEFAVKSDTYKLCNRFGMFMSSSFYCCSGDLLACSSVLSVNQIRN